MSYYHEWEYTFLLSILLDSLQVTMNMISNASFPEPFGLCQPKADMQSLIAKSNSKFDFWMSDSKWDIETLQIAPNTFNCASGKAMGDTHNLSPNSTFECSTMIQI